MDYYQVLHVPRDAKPRDITKAYRLLALKYHPDRCSRENLPATSRSEVGPNPGHQDTMALLNEAYECLRDPEKKRIYDLTGKTDSSGVLGESAEGVLEAADIENFVATYCGSDLERDDVRDFVKLRGGDVSQILEYIPLSTAADLERLLKIAAEFSGEYKAKFDRSCKKVRKNIGAFKRKEQTERKRFEKEHGNDSFADLVSKIKQNQKRRQHAHSAALTDTK